MCCAQNHPTSNVRLNGSERFRFHVNATLWCKKERFRTVQFSRKSLILIRTVQNGSERFRNYVNFVWLPHWTVLNGSFSTSILNYSVYVSWTVGHSLDVQQLSLRTVSWNFPGFNHLKSKVLQRSFCSWDSGFCLLPFCWLFQASHSGKRSERSTTGRPITPHLTTHQTLNELRRVFWTVWTVLNRSEPFGRHVGSPVGSHVEVHVRNFGWKRSQREN